MSRERGSIGALICALAAATFAGCSSSSNSGGGTIVPPPPPPPPPPPGVSVSVQPAFPMLPAFSQPLALVQAPGNNTRWYAVERTGVVRVFDNDPAVAASSVFIDISAIVDSGPGEAGLLGIAFHPNFQMNGEVYLSYTRTGAPLISYISRFRSPDGGMTLDPGTEEALMTVNQDFGNHNGGNIAFSPLDGFLYIGLGDGGGGGDPNDRAEDTTNVLGAMLRIDVNAGAPYAIPMGNMFFGNALCNATGFGMANCPEIFAWGLRNPWRWSFDSVTGELWVADVGQNMWEEVDRVVVGGNYGWDIREGAHCFEPPVGCATVGLIDPVAEYDHSLGNSITGGYVYRGTAIPGLVGSFVYGDFGSGRIWGLFDDGMGNLTPSELSGPSALGIASFGQDMNGEIYVVDLFSGQIFRIDPS